MQTFWFPTPTILLNPCLAIITKAPTLEALFPVGNLPVCRKLHLLFDTPLHNLRCFHGTTSKSYKCAYPKLLLFRSTNRNYPYYKLIFVLKYFNSSSVRYVTFIFRARIAAGNVERTKVLSWRI